MGGLRGEAVKKKRPRTCVGCGEESPKRELLRVVRSPDGIISYDSTGRAAGRGAYVCKRMECVKLAGKKRGFSRSLKSPIDDKLYSLLEEICVAAE